MRTNQYLQIEIGDRILSLETEETTREDDLEERHYIIFPDILSCNALVFMEGDKLKACWHITGSIGGSLYRNEAYGIKEYGEFVSNNLSQDIVDIEVFCCGYTTKYFGPKYKEDNKDNIFIVDEKGEMKTYTELEKNNLLNLVDHNMSLRNYSNMTPIFDVKKNSFFFKSNFFKLILLTFSKTYLSTKLLKIKYETNAPPLIILLKFNIIISNFLLISFDIAIPSSHSIPKLLKLFLSIIK